MFGLLQGRLVYQDLPFEFLERLEPLQGNEGDMVTVGVAAKNIDRAAFSHHSADGRKIAN